MSVVESHAERFVQEPLDGRDEDQLLKNRARQNKCSERDHIDHIDDIIWPRKINKKESCQSLVLER